MSFYSLSTRAHRCAPTQPLQERPKGWKEGTVFETKDEGHTLDLMLEVWICCSNFLGLKEI